TILSFGVECQRPVRAAFSPSEWNEERRCRGIDEVPA
ncbi:hypothetical protein NPIL_232671, partial [Nephila pilipes]